MMRSGMVGDERARPRADDEADGTRHDRAAHAANRRAAGHAGVAGIGAAAQGKGESGEYYGVLHLGPPNRATF
jgi:hypothetical protein